MALPHYKLNAPQQVAGMESFPVVMVPSDSPVRASQLKEIIFSRKTQAITALICMVAIATALWIYLEPTNSLFPENTGILMLRGSLAVAAITLVLLVFSAAKKFQSSDSFITPPETTSLLAGREALAATTPSSIGSVVAVFESQKRLVSEQANAVEFSCEDFVSEPFIEFLDESVIAELFSDEMVAPDCLIFSIEVKENVTQ
jgi:hypothetical protein